jgi:hypothetical protein
MTALQETERMPDDEGELGIYYKCLRGANAHFALTEPHSFAVRDDLERSWICYPIRREVVENLDLLSDVLEIDRADKKSGEETDVRLVFCQSESELSEKLIERRQT